LTALFPELPPKQPQISGIKSRYRPGDTLHGNCSSHGSRPAANLTWIINGHMVSYILHYFHTHDYKKWNNSGAKKLHLLFFFLNVLSLQNLDKFLVIRKIVGFI
jgi:hypothetical protein